MKRRIRIAQLLVLALVVYGVLTVLGIKNSSAARLGQACEGQVITGGCFFSQTTNGQGGYSVIDDNQARFWAEYQRLGGAQTVGYPISRRFVYDGFITQAFQKLVLQWRPEVGVAYPMNVFDELSEAGHDPRLFATRQTPYPLVNFDPPNATWIQIVVGRQALLNANAAIRNRYFSFTDPLNVFGLPTSRVEDMGNHYAVRTQRAVFQQWKEAVPWAGAGEVTIANGGDIAKEVGWFDPAWLTPEGAPSTPPPTPIPAMLWITKNLIVSPGTPNVLYVLQYRNSTGAPHRLLQSVNDGRTWEPFSGGLPVPQTGVQTLYSLGMDYFLSDGLIVIANGNVYRWLNDAWEWRGVCAQGCTTPLVEYGNPERMWTSVESYALDCGLYQSTDGGSMWTKHTTFGCGTTYGTNVIGIDLRTNTPLYFIDWFNASAPTPTVSFSRYDDETTEATTIFTRTGADYQMSATVHGATGHVYLATGERGTEIWFSDNPTVADPHTIRWENRYRFTETGQIRLLASGDGNGGAGLYAVVGENYYMPTRYLRSLDGGYTWDSLNIPIQ